jgi:hypothetical protein
MDLRELVERLSGYYVAQDVLLIVALSEHIVANPTYMDGNKF